MCLTFLGTGTSVGVPVIGCDCEVCLSKDPRNTRTRSSLFIEYKDTHILVDSGPDLREQALREQITKVDAVVYTHSHVDHVAGFDELRAFCWKRDTPLPLFASPFCLGELRNMFPWAFSKENTFRGYIKPDPHAVESSFKFESIAIEPLPVEHGRTPTNGYLFSFPQENYRVAYFSDIKKCSPEVAAKIKKVDLLIVDALRYDDHPSHMTVAEALTFAQGIEASQTYFTHMSHEIDHETLQAKLPPSIHLAHDGLKIEPTLV